MAKLPIKYDKRMRQVLGYRAVWEPGTAISLGDVATRKNGIFTDVARLADFGVRFRRERRKAAQLTLSAQGVSETLLQAGVQVPAPEDLKPNVEAELTIRFSRSNTYHLKTTTLSGEDIGDLLQVGRKLAKRDDWRFADYYVVWRMLSAKDFTFLGSLRKNREISLSGKGKAVARYLTAGVSAGLSKTSSLKLDLELIGTGGPIAIGVTRFRKDGRPRDV